MKPLLPLLLSLLITGCGTVNTVFRNDTVAANQLTRWRSHCDGVPRIYSGVSIDFCALHAEPRTLKSSKNGYPSAGLVVLDMAASGIADTVLLPYTIYTQTRYGGIEAARF